MGTSPSQSGVWRDFFTGGRKSEGQEDTGIRQCTYIRLFLVEIAAATRSVSGMVSDLPTAIE
jgi:hypothetical protein